MRYQKTQNFIPILNLLQWVQKMLQSKVTCKNHWKIETFEKLIFAQIFAHNFLQKICSIPFQQIQNHHTPIFIIYEHFLGLLSTFANFECGCLKMEHFQTFLAKSLKLIVLPIAIILRLNTIEIPKMYKIEVHIPMLMGGIYVVF